MIHLFNHSYLCYGMQFHHYYATLTLSARYDLDWSLRISRPRCQKAGLDHVVEVVQGLVGRLVLVETADQ